LTLVDRMIPATLARRSARHVECAGIGDPDRLRCRPRAGAGSALFST